MSQHEADSAEAAALSTEHPDKHTSATRPSLISDSSKQKPDSAFYFPD